MDIHLHDWRTKPILCKDLCANFTTIKSMFHMFFQVEVAIWRVRLSILDCSKWNDWTLKKNKQTNYTTIQDKQLTNVQWQKWQLVGATPPIPSASKYMFSKTVIGPMLDVERALCPHHEVKITFMKLKSQVGFLCWYGFKRHYCSALLPQHYVLLTPLTKRNGMLGNITTAL